MITAIDLQSERQVLPREYPTIPPDRYTPIKQTYAKLFRGSLKVPRISRPHRNAGLESPRAGRRCL